MTAGGSPTNDGERGTPESAPETPPVPTPNSPPEPDSGGEGLWNAYWERFRRQQVDDPVEEQREGYWDRFRRQQVDDPVDKPRPRSSS